MPAARSLGSSVVVVSALSASLLAGCWSTVTTAGGDAPNRYQLFASGYLGCRATEIAIIEHVNDSSATASWIAECGGREVVCGGYPFGSVHCAPRVSGSSDGGASEPLPSAGGETP